jgi:apolipoprotein N-acyltransferase
MNWLRRSETWLAIGGGVLAALSMPGFGAAPLAFVALIPLFLALERGRGFVHGYLFGLAFFAIDVRWVLMLVRFNPLIAPGYVLLVAYLALPFGLLGWLMTWRARRVTSWWWILVASALVVLAEYVRTLGPLGTGFSMLHQALYRIPYLIQSAAVLGSWSITALIVAINAAAYLAWREKRVRFALLALALLIVQGAFWFLPVGPDEDGAPLAVAIVSSNVPQEVKLDSRNLDALTERFLRLGVEATAGDPDLIVFPESFLPAYILDLDDVFSRLADLARAGETRLLFGTGTFRDGGIFNSTVLVDPEGHVIGMYDMVRPVPFGEYIPGRGILEAIGLGSWARALLPLDLSRGTGYEPLDEIGTPICFESTFPTASRQLTRAGATLLVTVTNDAWFAGSSELRAHFAAAVFRAVENRRSVVQAANGGISGIVDPQGRILSETFEETVSRGHVQPSTGRSIYTGLGDLPFVLAMGCAAAGFLAFRCRSVRRGRRTEE